MYAGSFVIQRAKGNRIMEGMEVAKGLTPIFRLPEPADGMRLRRPYSSLPMPHPRFSPLPPPARPHISRVVAFAAAVVVALSGCGKKPPTTGAAIPSTAPAEATTAGPLWPMARGGPQLHGRVPCPAPRNAVVEWTHSIKGAITSEAAVAAGVVVFGDAEGLIHALDLTTHQERWKVTTQDSVEATPAIADGRVLVGSNDGVFRALDLRDGKECWRLQGEEKFPTGATLAANPDGGEAWLLVNCYDGVCHCLRTRDGSSVWRHETQDYINGTPLLLPGGLVAFGGCDAVIHLIRLTDGTEVHQLKSDAQIVRSLAAWQDTVYGVNYANQLLAAAVTADHPSWLYEDNAAQFLTSPAVDETQVYVGSRDKHLHAVDRQTGKANWKFATGGRVSSAPLVFDDAVVFGSSDGRLYAVSTKDGRELWQLDLGEALEVAPAYANGRILIGGGDGTLFVIREGAGP